MEEDQHIKYFWNALETFSQVTNNLKLTIESQTKTHFSSPVQEELRKFIKFACNQERIPFGEPCRGGANTLTNVPPYPMKIAPPDGSGNIQTRKHTYS